MSNDRSFAVPKPVSDDTPDEYEVVLKGHFGSNGALFALVNHLREIGAVKQGRYNGRGDGSSEQTITLNLYELAKSYATRPEKPRIELRGYVYLVEGTETQRRKIGGTDDIQRRLGELKREFGEVFEVIHVIHTENWKAREKDIHDYLKSKGLHVDREFYEVNEFWEQWFISQPNEF